MNRTSSQMALLFIHVIVAGLFSLLYCQLSVAQWPSSDDLERISFDGDQTTESDDSFGPGGSKETTVDSLGQPLKIIRRGPDGRRREEITYVKHGSVEMEHRSKMTYDVLGRVISVQYTSGLSHAENALLTLRRTIEYSGNSDAIGTPKDEEFGLQIGKWQLATASYSMLLDRLSRATNTTTIGEPINDDFTSSIVRSIKSRDIHAICDRYVLDCPITVSRSSDWMEIILVRQFLRHYLIGGRTAPSDGRTDPSGRHTVPSGGRTDPSGRHTDPPGGRADLLGRFKDALRGNADLTLGNTELRLPSPKHKVSNVTFDGDVITVTIMVDDKLPDDVYRRAYEKELSPILRPLFALGKVLTVNIDHFTVSMMGAISVTQLKPEYREHGDTVNYDAVWSAIINTIGRGGYTLDSQSERRKAKSGSIATIPIVTSKEGFVNKYFLTVEMKPRFDTDSEFYFETLLHLLRRRASSREWTEVEVGDTILSLASAPRSTIPIFNEIKEVLRK